MAYSLVTEGSNMKMPHSAAHFGARGLASRIGSMVVVAQSGIMRYCRPGVDPYYIKLGSGVSLTHRLRVFNEAQEPLATNQSPYS